MEAIGNDTASTASCILPVGCWAIPCHSRWTFIEHRLDTSHVFEKAQRFHAATRGDILSTEVGMNSLSSPQKVVVQPPSGIQGLSDFGTFEPSCLGHGAKPPSPRHVHGSSAHCLRGLGTRGSELPRIGHRRLDIWAMGKALATAKLLVNGCFSTPNMDKHGEIW